MTHPVLITGAGTGIGQAIAQTLAEQGRTLVLMGRTEETLAGTQAACLGQHHIAMADVRDGEAVRNALQATGITSLSAVVANAGVGGENQYGEDDRWHELIDTNLTGTYVTVNEALPYLRNRRSSDDFRHIVLISSILARLGVPGYSGYCAAKAGLLGLMRSWATGFTAERILVNALCPGWVNTEMARQGIRGFAEGTGVSYEAALAEQMAMVPLGKMSEPEEIAAFTWFLMNDAQTSITGQTFDINNGALMPC